MFLANAYSAIFARRIFSKFHKILVKTGLKGLGLLYSHENQENNGELFFAKRVIKIYKSQNIFDVGANKGSYSKMFLDAGFGKEIFCFEPHPKTFTILDTSVRSLMVKKFDVALSNEEGSFEIYDYSSQDGSEHASLFKDVIESLHKSAATAHQVKTTTLDQFFKNLSIDKIGLLKIDTEGNELNVLIGAKGLIERDKIDIIHFEFNDMNIVSKVFMRDFFKILPRFNFYRLLPNDFLPLNQSDILFNELFSYQNIVAIRRDIDKEV